MKEFLSYKAESIVRLSNITSIDKYSYRIADSSCYYIKFNFNNGKSAEWHFEHDKNKRNLIFKSIIQSLDSILIITDDNIAEIQEVTTENLIE